MSPIYLEYRVPENISPATFFDVYTFNTNSAADRDENGNAISGSKKAKVLEYIDQQAITSDQKDVIYRAFGWAESELKNAPWHN